MSPSAVEQKNILLPSAARGSRSGEAGLGGGTSTGKAGCNCGCAASVKISKIICYTIHMDMYCFFCIHLDFQQQQQQQPCRNMGNMG
jgi:hypothetical protein